MNRISIVVALFAFAFSSCQSDKMEYWPISKFNIQPDALSPGEGVQTLSFSGSFHADDDVDAYNHYVVVSEESGDTVNLLCIAYYKDSGEKVLQYVGPSTANHSLKHFLPEGKVGANTTVENVFDKVYRWRPLDDLADNNHPTVFGALGTVTQNRQ